MTRSRSNSRRRAIAIMGLLSFLGFGTSKANAYDIPVKNFGEVVHNQIYRSAAPDFNAVQAARETLGIKTVLDLRDDWAPSAWRGWQYVLKTRLGINAVNIPMDDKSYPRAVDIDDAIGILLNPDNWPVLVHCQGGRHRTGGVIAEYRKRIQGWVPDAAYKEAKEFSFYSRWGHGDWKDYIKEPAHFPATENKRG